MLHQLLLSPIESSLTLSINTTRTLGRDSIWSLLLNLNDFSFFQRAVSKSHINGKSDGQDLKVLTVFRVF